MKPKSLCISNDAHYCSDEFLFFITKLRDMCVSFRNRNFFHFHRCYAF